MTIRGSMCLHCQTGIALAAAGIVQTGRVAFVQYVCVCLSWMTGKCVWTLWRALLFTLSASELNSSLWESSEGLNQCVFMAL